MQEHQNISVSNLIPENPLPRQPNKQVQNINSSRTMKNQINKRNNQKKPGCQTIQNSSQNLEVQNSSRKMGRIQNISRSKEIQNKSQLSNQSLSQNKSAQQLLHNPYDFDFGIQSNINAVANGLSHHLSSLRRTNLINFLSSKDSESRTERQNKLIMEILKHEPFFSIISSNYKLLYEISSKLEYKLVKQSSYVYRINEITEGYFILIRGCVQLSIPERMMNGAQNLMESENEKILRQIQKRNKQKLASSKKKAKFNSKTNSKMVNNPIPKSGGIINLNKVEEQDRQLRRGEEGQQVEVMRQKTKELNDFEGVKGQQQQGNKQKSSIERRAAKKQSSSGQKCELRQSVKKVRQIPSSKKSLPKGEEAMWSPTQLSFDDNSDILSENASSDGSVQKEQSPAKHQKQGTILEYIDKIVKVVEEGECFGEITVGEINRRATNALAKYDSHLIVIRKQHYDLISKASISSQMKVRYDFLLNLELFKKVYRYSIETFLYYITELPCQYKTSLYQEGDQIKYVYLVKNGEFNLSKTLNQSHKHKSNAKTMPSESADVAALRRRQNKCRQGVFKKVYSGQILGDCQVFLKKSHYNQSCQCTSQSGSIYRIDKHVFIEKILSSQNQVQAIKKYLNTKFKTKLRYLDLYINKHFDNETIARMLPPSKQNHSIYPKSLF